jgi:hypothetical protein
MPLSTIAIAGACGAAASAVPQSCEIAVESRHCSSSV